MWGNPRAGHMETVQAARLCCEGFVLREVSAFCSTYGSCHTGLQGHICWLSMCDARWVRASIRVVRWPLAVGQAGRRAGGQGHEGRDLNIIPQAIAPADCQIAALAFKRMELCHGLDAELNIAVRPAATVQDILPRAGHAKPGL